MSEINETNVDDWCKKHDIKRVVVAAACKVLGTGEMVVSARHFDPLMHKQIKQMFLSKESHVTWKQGFICQFGCFLDRKEAMIIAKASGQPLDLLRNGGNSEDLYSECLY